jgi:inorganic pyrophosphatase
MNLTEVPLGPDAPSRVNTIIEIPKGSTNKYEIDPKTGIIRLDRVLFSPLFYPCDYGYIPQTLYSDGDAIDTLVLMTHPTFPGCVVEGRPLGLLKMSDDTGQDDKVICSAPKDPRFEEVETLEDMSDHVRREIVHFFEVYKALEEKSVQVLGWASRDEALRIIDLFKLQ